MTPKLPVRVGGGIAWQFVQLLLAAAALNVGKHHAFKTSGWELCTPSTLVTVSTKDLRRGIEPGRTEYAEVLYGLLRTPGI
jgi:hypothetical protein